MATTLNIDFSHSQGQITLQSRVGSSNSFEMLLQNAEVCGKTPGQERVQKLLRLTGPLNNSKGSL